MMTPRQIGLVSSSKASPIGNTGFLAASAVEWFGAGPVVAVAGRPAGRIGERLSPDADRGIGPSNERRSRRGRRDRLRQYGRRGPARRRAACSTRHRRQRGGSFGGICAGTLALARAGLFKAVAHQQRPRLDPGAHEPAMPAPTAMSTCRTRSPTGRSSRRPARLRAPSRTTSCGHLSRAGTTVRRDEGYFRGALEACC